MSIVKECTEKDLVTLEEDSHPIPPDVCNSCKCERETIGEKSGWLSLSRGLCSLLDTVLEKCSYPPPQQQTFLSINGIVM